MEEAGWPKFSSGAAPLGPVRIRLVLGILEKGHEKMKVKLRLNPNPILTESPHLAQTVMLHPVCDIEVS